MGLFKSKVKLEDIDTNGDGLITRNEVHTYVESQIRAWKDIYEQKLSIKDGEIRSLQEEMTLRLGEKQVKVEEWKHAYEDLHQKYSEMMEDLRSESHKGRTFLTSTSSISPKSIERVVKEILADPNINLKKVPDWLEGPFYHNVIWITLMVLERVMKSFKIDTFGHEFYLVMSPGKEA